MSQSFIAISAPLFQMQTRWALAHVDDYLRSWSATGRYQRQHGVDPVAQLEKQLAPLWGNITQRQNCWPLALRAGY